jgi:hypothetical protein
MPKTAIAAALLALAGASMSLATPAAAQNGCGANGCNENYAYHAYNDGGLGRYCPPGQYPHSWTGGTGIRCEPVGGGTEFIYPN